MPIALVLLGVVLVVLGYPLIGVVLMAVGALLLFAPFGGSYNRWRGW